MVEIIIVLFLVLCGSIYSKFMKQPTRSTEAYTLGVKDEQPSSTVIIPTETPTPTISTDNPRVVPTIIPSPTAALKKETYTIAVFGDSIIDTMGERLEYLEKSLKTKYPETMFRFYNYGIGSQNVLDGINRFDQDFSYMTRHYPSLPSLRPDIIILGSFSYNPFFPSDKKKHSEMLQSLVGRAKQITKNTYLLAEIAPIKLHFGQGPSGVNWKDDESYEQATHIIEQLDNVAVVGKKTNTPVIDTFGPSQVNSEKEGRKDYINQSDGIHPSIEGHQFMADKIAETIKFDQ
jgi:lysophospholipase L1-like esterase